MSVNNVQKMSGKQQEQSLRLGQALLIGILASADSILESAYKQASVLGALGDKNAEKHCGALLAAAKILKDRAQALEDEVNAFVKHCDSKIVTPH